MKTRKVFIPDGTKACNRHTSVVEWSNVEDTGRNSFKAKYIEDLIDLLCDKKLMDKCDIPGSYHSKKNIFRCINKLKKRRSICKKSLFAILC